MSPETDLEAGLPTGSCVRCTRQVLTYLQFDSDRTGVRRCLHCDHPVEAVEATSAATLATLGYTLIGHRDACCGSGICARARDPAAPPE